MKKSPLAVVLLIVFIDLIGFGMIIPILGLYAEKFQTPNWLIGLLFASYSLMQFLFSPVLGGISDRYGRRPVLLLSLVGSCIGYLLLANATSMPMLFVARIIQGVFGASISTASAYIADITPSEQRTRRIGLVGAAFGIGFVLGPAIGGILSAVSTVAPYWFAACLSGANAIVAYFILPEPNQHIGRVDANRNLAEVFRQAGSKRLVYIALSYFVQIVGFGMVTAVFVQVCKHRFGLDQQNSSWILALIGLVGALIQGGGIGRLTNRFGDLPLALAGFATMAASLLVFPLAHSVLIFIFLSIGLAIGNSLAQPTINAMASKGASELVQGRALGVLQSAGSLGRVFGPFLGEELLFGQRAFGNPGYGNTAFVLAGLIMLVALLIACNLLRPENRAVQVGRPVSS